MIFLEKIVKIIYNYVPLWCGPHSIWKNAHILARAMAIVTIPRKEWEKRSHKCVTHNKNRLVHFNYCRWTLRISHAAAISSSENLFGQMKQWTIKHVERREPSENIKPTAIWEKKRITHMYTQNIARINSVMSSILWIVVAGSVLLLVFFLLDEVNIATQTVRKQNK